MGIEDRDYYREKHRRPNSFKENNRKLRSKSQGFSYLFYSILMLVALMYGANTLFDKIKTGKPIKPELVAQKQPDVPLNVPVLSQEKSISVSFKNNSNNILKCEVLGQSDYVPFINLEGKQERHFDNFNAGSKVRCYISIDNRSTTVLTYFDIISAGNYELLFDRVPCPSCRGIDWRWATVVVYPNGQADYNRL